MADIYGLIPDVDSRGIAGQIGKFRQWNPDPVGDEAKNLAAVNPQLAAVVARARADNPNLRFVLGSGLRTGAQQDLAHQWGWSPIGAKGGGDADVHMRGNAVDLWPLNDQGQVTFDAGAQSAVSDAVKAAAAKLNVNLTAGGDWKHPDQPHFEMTGNPTWTPAASSAPASAPATTGTTVNTSNVIDTLSRNIAQIESGTFKDPYTALNPSTHAIGKYQVMPNNVPGWTMAALGHSMTPDEFKASPAAQEAVFRDQMQRNLQLYSPKDAASIWFTGKPYNVAGGNVRDAVGTTNANYVARATAGLPDSGTFTPGSAVAASSTAPSSSTPATPGTSITSLPAAAGASSGVLPGFGTKQASDQFLAGLKQAGITPVTGAPDEQPDLPRPPPLNLQMNARNVPGPAGVEAQARQLAPQLTGYSPGIYGQSLNSQPLSWGSSPIGAPAWLKNAGPQGAPGIGTSLNSLQAMDPQMYADKLAMLYGTGGGSSFGGGYG